MKKSFFILNLMTTTTLAVNAWADCTPINNENCGTNCSYSLDANCLLTVNPVDAADPVSISSWAFNGTPATEIVFNGNVTSIGEGAFYSATNLTSVTLPGSITSIGNYTFQGATSLTSVVIPNSVTSIGASAFANAYSLTSITIPNSVTSIGNTAFFNAGSLTSITIPDSFTSIGASAFASMPSLTSITIPDSVTSIGESAFSSTGSLTSITIPDSVTSIGDYAFFNAYHLASVYIPDSVTSIGNNAFKLVPSSAEIYCSDQACKDRVIAAGYTGNNFVDYTKGSDGIYTITEGGVMYASAEDMRAHQNACASETQCREKVQEYKETKAEQMAQSGILCQTKTGCLKLMDMVSDTNTTCLSGVKNSIANCSAYAKANNIALNDPDPVNSGSSVGGNGGSGGNSGSSTGSGKRIYTVEEARQAVEAAGTETVNFRIRYR